MAMGISPSGSAFNDPFTIPDLSNVPEKPYLQLLVRMSEISHLSHLPRLVTVSPGWVVGSYHRFQGLSFSRALVIHGKEVIELPKRLGSLSSSEDRVNDVRRNLLPDGGGIEETERRAGETPGPSTVMSHGTDGLENFVQSVIAPCLREAVVNLDNWKRILGNFNLENVLRNTPSYSHQLNQIINNVYFDFLQLQETNSKLSLEELEVSCVTLCWSSRQRVEFFCEFSDTVLAKVKAMARDPPEEPNPLPNQPVKLKGLLEELESKWQQHFPVNWIGKIAEWIEKIDLRFRPLESDHETLRGLLRLMRNRWHHSDEFREYRGLCSAETFYNYFDTQFPNLLMVSYGVAYQCCRREPWFEKYHPKTFGPFGHFP